MMKQVYILILFLCANLLSAQIFLTGTVRNRADQTPIFNCPIILRGSDGTLVQTRTDSLGFYSLKLNANTKYDVYTSIDRTIKTPTAKYGFLASDDHGLFETNDTVVKNYSKDFEIDLEKEIRLPVFYFKKGDVNFNPKLTPNASSLFDTLVNTLNENPKLIIEIRSYSAAEGSKMNEEKLIQNRTLKIFNELMRRGINKKRIQTYCYDCDSKLKIISNDIETEKLKNKEKEAFIEKKRRTTIKIISWDYVPEKNESEEIPTYKPPIQKDIDK